MAVNKSDITVEVAYALPERQELKVLSVPLGTTALEAVRQSGIVEIFPEIELENAQIGIFSQVLGSKGLAGPADYELKSRDRVEIYRPLIADPKEVRRRRAKQAKAQKEQ